ncbi:MAG: tetratricopeptide repeat protein [Ginsengibacter sp.]
MAQDINLKLLERKIDQLNIDAWAVRVNDSTRALMLSEAAVKLAKDISYSIGLAEGLRTLGFSYIRLSKHQEALGYIEHSLKIFESLNHRCGQADDYEYLGIIQRSLGNYEASLNYLFKSLELRQQEDCGEGEPLSFYHLGVTYKYLGSYEQALDHFLKSLSIARSKNYPMAESYALNTIGLIYLETENYSNALEYFYQSLAIRSKSGDKWGEAGCLDNIGFCHFKMCQYEKAIAFYTHSLQISTSINDQKGQGNSVFHLGNIYEQCGQYQDALKSYNQSLQIRKQIGDKKGEAEIILFLAGLYAKENFHEYNIERSFELMNEALKLGNDVKANDLLSKIHHGLYDICKLNKLFADALIHLETHVNIEKEIHTAAITQKTLHLEISHRVEKSRQEAEIYKLRNIELAGLYEESNKQKEEIGVQKTTVEKALEELKAAQTRLIQSEKMASLGELTAGIAHEIQNPLNFVNNFSEVNIELVAELNEELNKTNIAFDNKQLLEEIIENILQNHEKILSHGKRADAIVKSMLLHSRKNTNQKEPADLNALADEYLRLSYHGLRAKDNTFNVSIKTDYDESIGKINIIPQDIGRVLLNIFNNAFYAVNEKKKRTGEGYDPTISVSTKKLLEKPDGNWVEIRIKDNGTGIPQKVLDKIFQPFFTTKPTGQGTGLGLSLSYDIIMAHGGEIKVGMAEAEGAVFIIQIPLQ